MKAALKGKDLEIFNLLHLDIVRQDYIIKNTKTFYWRLYEKAY